MDDLEAGELAAEFEIYEPEEILEWAFERFGTERYAQVTSFQAEGVVLIDMAWRINPDVRVITIDTGRLPQASLELIDQVRERYDIQIEVLTPGGPELEQLIKQHGVNLFYKSVELRLRCCHTRKVLPLQRALNGLDAWTTGLRREQWATRGNLRKIDLDHDHGGLVKLNPLVDWTHDEVWDYIRENELPYHAYYDQGFPSIGCAPCTRPVAGDADPRSGRWWWETGAPKECGMHCSIETGSFEHEVAALVGRQT